MMTKSHFVAVLGRGCRRCGSRHRCANEIVCSRHRRDARQSRPWRLAPYQSAYDQQRFSPLTQINKGNVAQLRMAWSRGLPVGVQESTPIVYRGVMYVMAPGSVRARRDQRRPDLGIQAQLRSWCPAVAAAAKASASTRT